MGRIIPYNPIYYGKNVWNHNIIHNIIPIIHYIIRTYPLFSPIIPSSFDVKFASPRGPKKRRTKAFWSAKEQRIGELCQDGCGTIRILRCDVGKRTLGTENQHGMKVWEVGLWWEHVRLTSWICFEVGLLIEQTHVVYTWIEHGIPQTTMESNGKIPA